MNNRTCDSFSLKLICLMLLLWQISFQALSFEIKTQRHFCLNLMPCPQKIILSGDKLKLDENPTIYIQGMSQLRKESAIERLNSQVQQLKLPQFNEFTFAEHASGADVVVVVKANINSNSYRLPQLGDDESYQLNIAADQNNSQQARIIINANTDFGALHGLTTLQQILTVAPQKLLSLPQITIDDKPRFKWRGLLIDSVRHFIPLNSLKRQLDGMAAAKLNVFHWHLTDDQGWRFESKRYPKLHQLASDNLFYTQEEIKELVHYASLLGIRVVPEFDVPGHASAIAVAYPELITAPDNYHMERHWGVFEPLLDVSNAKVYRFVDEIINELTQLFPDAYMHIGGDEVNPKQWQESTAIAALMQERSQADSHDVQRFFNSKIQKILAKYQRKMMGWDEIFHQDLPDNIMVQSWRGLDSLNVIAANGYQGLLSTGYYIDQPQYTGFHYLNDPQGKLTVDSKIAYQTHDITKKANEKWNTWAFTIPRLKGSAVKGLLTFISQDNAEHGRIKAYLKLNDGHYQSLVLSNDIAPFTDSIATQQLAFSTVSWMGPLRFKLTLTATEVSGGVMIGNTYYPVEVKKTLADITPSELDTIKLLPPLTVEQAENVLGGEATLWTEMVDQSNIDLRIWPRLFAIAERLWSSRDLTDVDNMYQRLALIDQYAANIVGLAHQQQQQEGMANIAALFSHDTDDINHAVKALMVIAQAFEPAHYYTRHHIKYQQNNYHQQAPLNYFVDYLPVESTQIMAMNKQVKALLARDQSAALIIRKQLVEWRNASETLHALLEKSNVSSKVSTNASMNNNEVVSVKKPLKIENIEGVLSQLDFFLKVAFKTVEHCAGDQQLTQAQRNDTQQQLNQIVTTPQEQVLAGAPLISALLSQCF